MTILHVIILSIIEGITEFLPISSTGHLILASHVMQIPQTDFLKTFQIIIQLGAILAVVVLYFRKLLQSRYLWKTIIIAFIPSAIIGGILYKFIKGYLIGNDLITAIALIVGGIILILCDRTILSKQKSTTTLDKISTKQSLTIGLAQSLAIIPGVSRSAATIIGGVATGLTKQSAVEFSFFLAIPTMLAASTLDLVETRMAFSSQELLMLVVGFIGAFITALFAVKFFIGYIQKNSFAVFGYYRIAIGLLYLMLFAAR